MTEQQLTKALRAVEQEFIDFPPETDVEKDILQYRRCLWEVKLECERMRSAFRIEYAKTRKTIVTRIEGNLQIEDYKSMYNWEAIRDYLTEQINEKEIKAIGYFTEKINQLRK